MKRFFPNKCLKNDVNKALDERYFFELSRCLKANLQQFPKTQPSSPGTNHSVAKFFDAEVTMKLVPRLAICTRSDT